MNKNVTSGKPSNHNRNINKKSNQSLANTFVCTCFYKTHLGSYTEPAGHLVHYSLLIWSHIGTKGVLSFFHMEPSRAKTMGIVTNSCSRVCTSRKACNSSERVKDYLIFHKISTTTAKIIYNFSQNSRHLTGSFCLEQTVYSHVRGAIQSQSLSFNFLTMGGSEGYNNNDYLYYALDTKVQSH